MRDATRSALRAAAVAAAAISGLVSPLGSTVAWADGSPGTQTTAAASSASVPLAVQAQELAGQIAADGRRLDELDAEYFSAQMRSQQIAAAEAGLQATMTATSRAVSVARADLKEQAVLAYVAGGGPVISLVPGHAGDDPSLTVAYAQIVAGTQQRDADAYRRALTQQTQEAATLAATEAQLHAVVATLTADRAAAQSTLESERVVLSRVQGQMAVDVAAVEQRQAQAEQQQVTASLVSRGQAPPPPAAPPVPAAAVATVPTARSTPSTVPAPSAPHPAVTSAPAPSTAPTTTPRVTVPPTTPPTTAPASASQGPQAPGVPAVLAYARAQLGKPYQWGGAGPDAFDCSGLVMMAWAQAGVSFPHLAQAQYDMTERIPLSDLSPGDLVFFGTPSDVYHVGIYVGGGDMIDAPETGQDVSVQSIYWTDLLGGGRVTR